jgi:GntR family transcriptional regulator/MocR family aminotransferase
VQGLDKYQRTLYLGTFSKTLFPGLRMGYMVLPRELVKAFTYARSMLDGHTPQILQLTLARFMEDGHYNAHVRAMRKLYAGRQAIMLDAIGKHLGDVVTASRPQGGLQIPCVLHEGWSEEKTIRQAANAGVQLPGLSRLYAGGATQQGWLLGYSSLTAHEIETAMRRLAHALKAR